MASSYTISGGTSRESLESSPFDTFAAIQVSSDSALNADITVLLQHSSDGVEFFNLGTAKTMTSGAGGVYLEAFDYTLNNLYLYIDVQTATLGTLNFFQSTKKKVNSGEVDATIIGEVDANITNSEVITKDVSLRRLLQTQITEQKITNKILSEALNQPLYTENDLQI